LNGGQLQTYEMLGDEVTDELEAGDLVINGVEVGAAAQDAAAIAAAINSAATGVTAEATNAVTTTFVTVDGDQAGETYTLTINDVVVIDVADNFSITAQDVADEINNNAELAAAGITAEVDGGGDLVITAADGRNITIDEDITGADGTGVGNGEEGDNYGSVRLTSDSEFAVSGDGAAAAGLMAGPATVMNEDYGAINVLKPEDADIVLRVIDQALTSVNGTRADLGAVQNRFESVVANLSTSVENLSASRSRILDTDFAAETASLTRAQVLQQAGVAMLAQANMMPQNVLALLR